MIKLVKLTILCFLFNSIQVFAQVQGISCSKLSSVCVEPVSPKALEFEPSFGYSQAKYEWDNSSRRTRIYSSTDSVGISSGMAFRLTYGVMDGLEIGLLLPTDASQYSLGAKYKFYESAKFAMAGVLGTSIHSGNGVIDKAWRENNASTIAGGVVMSKRLLEKICMDMDIQYQQAYSKKTYSQMFISSDIGYWYKEYYQFIIGLYYQHLFHENNMMDQELVTLNAGITIESSENFLIVANMPIDIWGRNSVKTFGFGLAFTIMFN